MWKRKLEWVPWYRARNYKGNLTEAQKRQLDAFRTQPKHPAATFDDLPNEVQSYLSGIQIELYDKKQEGAAGRAFLYSAIGAGLLFLNYKSCFAAPDVWVNSGAVLLLVFAWFGYWRQWHKNAEEFTPKDAPWRATEEGIRQQWELNYITRSRGEGQNNGSFIRRRVRREVADWLLCKPSSKICSSFWRIRCVSYRRADAFKERASSWARHL